MSSTRFDKFWEIYNSERLRRGLLYLVLIVMVFWILLPLWAAFVTAFKSQQDLQTTAPYQPSPSPTLEPLRATFEIMIRPLFNSLTFTIFATIFSCLIGSMAGFILSRIQFKGSETVFLLIIVGIFIPYQAVLVPLFLTMARLGLINNLLALVITHTAFGIPICTLLFRSFYEEIPESLINAAIVDGAGIWRIYRKIVLPLSTLPFIVATVFQFTNIWNDFLFGLILSSGINAQPASVALSNLKGSQVALWHYQMAGTLWYSLPSLLVYFFLGKYLMRGFMTGALKG